MKKLFTLFALIVSIISFGQTDSTKKITPYISAGLSISSSNDFSAGSYPSVEFGIMGKNISGGIILGRSFLKDVGKKSDGIENYFAELKSSVFVSPLNNKSLCTYAIFGLGTYGSFNRAFIEYGAGFSYSFSKFSYFIQSSNWDGVWYVTPGLTYNF